ncbi:hypothetical protein ACET3Z_001071 [Daucus carota]
MGNQKVVFSLPKKKKKVVFKCHNLQLKNISPTEKEIEELQLEDTIHIDAHTSGHPPPSNKGASTFSNLPHSGMSKLEMENKLAMLTSEVDDLKKTIGDMRSHFDLEFSKLCAINGISLDPLSYMNQSAVNNEAWAPWPQSNQDNSAKCVFMTGWDNNVDDIVEAVVGVHDIRDEVGVG